MPERSRSRDTRQDYSTTRWSLVLAAADSKSPRYREALSTLCHLYWPPVYAYVRHKGYDPEAAQDLTQGFFLTLLEKKYLRAVAPARGRFRSFLMTSVGHYLSDERDRVRARKRGGGVQHLTLDFHEAEKQYLLEPSHDETPERVFERRWAVSLLRQTLGRLRDEMDDPESRERFHRLSPFLTGGADVRYRQVAGDLGMTEGSVKVAVHRMRRRFGELLHAEVAQTVHDPNAVEEEVRYLLSVMGS